jgi:L-lactate dehydrogenase complex protein LldG
MTAKTSSRRTILDSIRTATQPTADNAVLLAGEYAILPRTYTRTGHLDPEARIALMVERLREYDAEVVETTPESLPTAIAAQLVASGKHTFVAPPGLPPEWLAPGPERKIDWKLDWKVDHGLSTSEIESAEGVVTAAFCAVADSGTIILHQSATEGRRVLTLLPDWHLCILRSSQIVETLPEYFDRCPQAPTLVTTISGPSATADIEMTRIKGVHGPRFLHVIIVRDHTSPQPPTQPFTNGQNIKSASSEETKK